MKSSLIIFILMLLTHSSFGQMDSTNLFERSKGELPLPISKYLRIYNNENLKRFTSNQFDSTLRIITDSSYQVNAVYDGKIISIIVVEDEYSIVTKFGSYYLGYSRLTKPDLQEGEFIKAGQSLGYLVKCWTEENYTLEIMLSNDHKERSAQKWIKW